MTHPLVQLAKSAVEYYLEKGGMIEPPSDLPKEYLAKKAGVFVTINKEGKLRGCIGTYLPTEKNIAQEVIRNSLVAATEDYRFGPIKKEEKNLLSYIVYVLNEPEMIQNPEELNPKKYGIIVRTVPFPNGTRIDVLFDGHSPFKSGLLLPDLEGIETVEQQIAIACQKGGINPKYEKILIYRFSAEKFD